MDQLVLSVLDPPKQCEIADVAEGLRSGDRKYALHMCRCVHETRTDIKEGRMGCIACGAAVTETVGVTFIVAVHNGDEKRASRAVICANCTEDHTLYELQMAASHSIAQTWIERHGRGNVHEPGHA